MGNDQAHEPDGAGGRDRRPGDECSGHEHGSFDPLRLDAELKRLLLPQGQEVQPGRLPGEDDDADGEDQRQDRQRPPAGWHEVAHEPEDHALKLGRGQEGRDQHDARGEEQAGDHAREEQRGDGKAPVHLGDRVHAHRGQEGPGEGEERDHGRVAERARQPQQRGDRDAEGGAAAHPQDSRIGQRVPGDGLEAQACQGQGGPDHRGQDGPGKANLPDDRHDGILRIRSAREERPHHLARRDRHAPDHHGQQEPGEEDPRQAEDGERSPPGRLGKRCPRHHRAPIRAKTSGWMARASRSTPSTTRGPGRWIVSPGTAMMRPDRTAGTLCQPLQASPIEGRSGPSR